MRLLTPNDIITIFTVLLRKAKIEFRRQKVVVVGK